MAEIRNRQIKEIPAVGCECWFSLYRDKKNKLVQPGYCRLRLQLAARKSSESVEGRNSDIIADYHALVHYLYLHALTAHNSLHVTKSDSDEELFEQLSERSSFILDQFVAHYGVDDLTQRLVHLAVLLEMKSEHAFYRYISDSFIKDKLNMIKKEYDQLFSAGTADQHRVTELEKTILDEALSSYLHTLVDKLRCEVSMPTLFPPKELKLEEFNNLVSNAVNLLCLPLWSVEHDNSQPRQEFSAFVAQQLQECVRKWLQNRLDQMHSGDADPVLSLTEQFVVVLRDTTSVLSPMSSISQYFSRLGVDYYKIASIACDSKLSSKAQELMLEMDGYQVTYNRFGVNIRESSIVTLQHYYALHALYTTIRGSVSERELFRISINNYQEWFKVAVTFWLQTFREECMRRMEKALEIEKDVVQVTSLVKYSNSVVDVLSCFAKMTSEWRDIDFADADICLLGVTKITDTVCDCVKLYLEKVINILESNGYYDYIDNQQFDVTDQLCITLNNISHVSGYLSELSSLLHWDIVSQQLSVKHEDEAVGQTALRSLGGLVAATNEDVNMQSRVLSQQIIEKIVVDLKKYTYAFTRCHNDLPSDVVPLLDYLENNLKVLYKKLDANIYPLFSEEILKAEMIIMLENLEVGQAPTYYEKILDYARTISSYFYTGGVDAAAMAGCKLSCKLKNTLKMNSLSSDQLMLLYYKSVLNNSVCSHEYFGDLVVKVGYRRISEGVINVYINVVHARNIPGMSKSGVSCPFVSLELCPLTMFPVTMPCRTPVRTSTINPVYEEKFEFTNIAEEYREAVGSVIIFSVWHHETVLSDTFLGEVVLPLCDLRELTAMQTVDDLPAVMMPLRRPREPRDGPYKVLKERYDKDKIAHVLLDQRNRTVAFRTRCRFCRPVKTIVATITGRKLEVTGRRDSVCTLDLGRTTKSPHSPCP